MLLLPLAERALRRALNASGIESRWVQTRVATHHVYDTSGRGSLPTVVALHGINATASSFARLMRLLRPHVRRVLAPEAPGHGFSSDPIRPLDPDTLREAMVELLDRELDEPSILFGNSLGGSVALDYAMARPERVRGLFLVSPAGALVDDDDLRRFLAVFRVSSPADARRFLALLYHRTPWFVPLVAAEVHHLFERDVIRSFTSAVRAEHLFTPERLRALTMPIHLVWGRSERLMPESHLEYFRRSLPPHAIIEEPEGMGHCAHLDDPVGVAGKVLRFARALAEAEGVGLKRRAG